MYLFNFKRIHPDKQLIEFGDIKTTVSLDEVKSLLTSEDFDLYTKNAEKDIFNSINNTLKSNKIGLTYGSEKSLTLHLSDLYSRTTSKQFYIINLSLIYFYNGKEKKLSTSFAKETGERLTYKSYIEFFDSLFNKLISSIILADTYKNKSSNKLLLLLNDKKLQSSDYTIIFERLIELKADISEDILLELIEANDTVLALRILGYAIEHDKCHVIQKIIEYALYFTPEFLQDVMLVLSESKCRDVEGFFMVLSTDSSPTISKKAKEHLIEYRNNFKLNEEIIYENGKKIKP